MEDEPGVVARLAEAEHALEQAAELAQLDEEFELCDLIRSLSHPISTLVEKLVEGEV